MADLAYLNANEGIHQGGLADILEIEPITPSASWTNCKSAASSSDASIRPTGCIWQLYLRDTARPLISKMSVIGDATRADALAGLSDEERAYLVRHSVA